MPLLGIELLVAFAVGMLVASTDIGRQHPTTWGYALNTRGGWGYMAINGLISLPTVAVIDGLGWNLLLPAGVARAAVHGGIAGLGGMGLLRAEFVPARSNKSEPSAGALSPEHAAQAAWLRATIVVNFFMDQANRSITPSANLKIRADADRIMSGVTFEAAQTMLPLLCFKLYGNSTPKKRDEAAKTVGAIGKSGFPPEVLVQELGAYLIEEVGCTVLARAVKDLGHSIRDQTRADTVPAHPPSGTKEGAP